MRALPPRPAAPPVLADADRAAWYADLRKTDGTIKDRWGRSGVRDALLALGDGCCAWCGRRLEKGWPVDHVLPKEHFPRLAYCWENLLPSCSTCNLVRKRAYAPPALLKDTLIDPALTPADGEHAYEPRTHLLPLEERLVEPALEDPSLHLRFEPVIHGYVAHTDAGRITLNKLFSDKDYAERCEDICRPVLRQVESARDTDDLVAALEEFVALVGCRAHIYAYATFWSDLLRPDLGALQPSSSTASTPGEPTCSSS